MTYHNKFILVDGSNAFEATVSGIDPTESDHLVTKHYVDGVSPATYSWKFSGPSGPDYVKSTLSTWETVANVGFFGTDTTDVNTFDYVAWVGSESHEGFIRVYDYTNASVITTISGINNTDKIIQSAADLSNLPTDQAVFEVQIKIMGVIGAKAMYLSNASLHRGGV